MTDQVKKDKIIDTKTKIRIVSEKLLRNEIKYIDFMVEHSSLAQELDRMENMCPACEGTGEVICERCGGTGEVDL